MEMYAQGDILFVRRGMPSEKGEEIMDGVIARGEITGHTHRLRPGQDAVLRAVAGLMYIEAMREAVVEHVLPDGRSTGDHDSVSLPEGIWEVRRQREWTPEGYRQVAD